MVQDETDVGQGTDQLDDLAELGLPDADVEHQILDGELRDPVPQPGLGEEARWFVLEQPRTPTTREKRCSAAKWVVAATGSCSGA